MLDKLPHVIGEHLPVMRIVPGLSLHIEAVLLGPINDGRQGHLLMVCFSQKVSDIAIVVVSYRYVGILYHILFDLELFNNVVFNGLGDCSGFGASFIVNRELMRTVAIRIDDGKNHVFPMPETSWI